MRLIQQSLGRPAEAPALQNLEASEKLVGISMAGDALFQTLPQKALMLLQAPHHNAWQLRLHSSKPRGYGLNAESVTRASYAALRPCCLGGPDSRSNSMQLKGILTQLLWQATRLQTIRGHTLAVQIAGTHIGNLEGRHVCRPTRSTRRLVIKEVMLTEPAAAGADTKDSDDATAAASDWS